MEELKPYLELNNCSKMPIVGLGTFQCYGEAMEEALDAALEAGYRHIDTAYVYENEAAIGRALKRWLDSGRVKREDLFITTKLPNIGFKRERVEKYLRRSLEALQLSYVDLYLVHQTWGLLEQGEDVLPRDDEGELLLDLTTDLVGVWKGMEDQVDAGRARSIGLCNHNARQIKRILRAARIRPVCLQIELYLYFQQRELVAFCRALDIAVVAYAPLGSPGMVDVFTEMGGETDMIPRVDALADPTVLEIAEKHGRTPAQVLLRHTVQRGIAVIPKSSQPARIEENFQVLDFSLDEEDVDQLDSLDGGRKYRLFSGNILKGMSKHPEYAYNDPY
ncbi:1,5-anhydro-D-fructose reductase-like [Bacillus rossius redtenbacheri]|uniref:1,5-anhydro-D-fructose reductase-like n=1 Tax=Bacillus rossius redtenbacheri TaxID=93214 RepID=UPI002FDD7250